MDERIDRILLEPCLLSRFDDSDCPSVFEAETDETSHRRLAVVQSTVRQRRMEQVFQGARDAGTTRRASSGNDWNYGQLLCIALVDNLCQVSEPKDLSRQKRLFQKIAKALVQTGITSPLCFSHQLHGLREHVRLAFAQMIANAQKAVHFEDSLSKSHSSNIPKTVDYFPLSAVSLVPISSKSLNDRSQRSAVVVSRYKLDFEEIEQLGKGGFGAVFKVRNYLDSQFYAVKKIVLNLYKVESCFRALREVKNLAVLNHPHIVRYYASWLEFDALPRNVNERRTVASSRSRKVQVREISCESATNGYLEPFKLRQCLSSPDISSGLPVHSQMDANYYESSLPAIVEADSSGEEARACQQLENFPGAFAMTGSLALYLQMELCSSTLRTWLNQRNSNLSSAMSGRDFDKFACVDKEANKKILRQILEALAYIHSHGIIHRDLKPSNVFLRYDVNVQSAPHVLLGDFGLSCYAIPHSSRPSLTDELTSSNDSKFDDVETRGGGYRHSTGMGTLAYSAPEQLRSQFYDCKADMFSFGIIALEMYFPFSTYMERIHNIMRVRDNDLDETFQRRLPLEAAIIRQLVQSKAALRPAARQLLDEEVVFVDASVSVNALKLKLKEVEEELARLRLHVSGD